MKIATLKARFYKLCNECLRGQILVTIFAKKGSKVDYNLHFASLESMLSPELNIAYAAQLLSKLKVIHGDWHKALRHYHSANSVHNQKYSRKVVMCWLGVIHH